MASKKIFYTVLSSGVILIMAVILLAFLSRPDGKLHLIACDVGQGDAILVVTPSGKQLLIDGGPNNSVLTCLGANMPFWDRKIEMVVLTHPQADHMVGLTEVLRRFEVEKIVANNTKNESDEYKAWQNEVKQENVSLIRLRRGQTINFGDGLEAKVEWPIDGNYNDFVPKDLNETSIILRLRYDSFCALMTGDAPKITLETIYAFGQEQPCTVLKVPHHGSKNSISMSFWQTVKPNVAIISAGKNNRYGHPHEEVLGLLGRMATKVLETSKSGEIEIITDGKRYEIR